MKDTIAKVGTIMLPTYKEPPAETLPMFAENRVHQRSSGNPYPNPVVQRVDRGEKENREYCCVTLENDYLRIEILPELGGRIYSALDKTTGYDFFYKQHVIKPALIGCLGSWTSGGMEFNWPFHHRASTFMPTDYFVETTSTGGKIVWLSEHDPIDRMKGMVGICLEPNEAWFETRMRVCNRTPVRKSFLWWENTAVPVNEAYQIFFPPDVSYVQFHYKRSVTTYPVASNALGVYNGIRYPEDTDISMHKNTRQPTSYFCAPSEYDFFGGYDHGRRCGVVHIANHHTSPGKKMFTWAYNQLSTSWENALTDTDGAYAELMASSYSDNQPDFSWLEPYETKTFSQYWYPIGALGVPSFANLNGALRWEGRSISVQLTHSALAEVIMDAPNGEEAEHFTAVMRAGEATEFRGSEAEIGARVRVVSDGKVLLDYTIREKNVWDVPECTQDMPNLKTERSAQELYREGVHVQQYRDPAIEPDSYWCEALQRDPEHSDSLLALSDYRLRQCRFDEAEELVARGIASLTKYNKRTESGRCWLLRARIHLAKGRVDDAYNDFWRASWNMDCYSSAMMFIAAIDGQRGQYDEMAAHAAEALRYNADHPLAGAYRALALQKLGRDDEAAMVLRTILKTDPLNHLARYASVIGEQMAAEDFYAALHSDPNQTALDLYFDLAQAGFDAEGKQLLRGLKQPNAIVLYLLGENEAASKAVLRGAFPWRTEEFLLLERVTAEHPEDAQAQYLFGCILYAKRQYARAADCFAAAVALQPTHAAAHRCLAVAYYSHLNRRNDALSLLETAFRLAPQEEQLVYEIAWVRARLGLEPDANAAFIRANGGDNMRDDLCVELARALNLAGKYDEALELLQTHAFIPCEGGEHAVADQYMYARHARGRMYMRDGNYEAALTEFREAQSLPQNLGAGIWNEVKYVPHQFYEAQCLDLLNRKEEAEAVYAHILALQVDYFTEMHLKELPYYQAKAYCRMGNPLQARALMDDYQKRVRRGLKAADAGFFATTPFFLSYVEPAADARAAVMHRLLGYFELYAHPEKAAAEFAQAQALDPQELYAPLEGKLLK